jgi:hypothetical protein
MPAAATVPKGPNPGCGGGTCCDAVTYSVQLSGDWSQGALNFGLMGLVFISLSIYIVTLLRWGRSWHHAFYFNRIVLAVVSLFFGTVMLFRRTF